ncbi:hypothetical protein LSTR_LSTR014217 [Laodelphax striatellus]|uniref:Uncharacterized protein n=1 Tax=Laodelphax striatellus TaxID=195883 RepID=A0A482WW29_LAOST|nr:hypothetical protein LSTR_LSTR014217 [Laodelphax striatellus]
MIYFVNYFTDDLGYHPLVEYNSASPSGSSRTQFAMGEKAVAALVKSISDIKTTHDFDGARKLAANKKQEGIGKLNADAKNSKISQKPGSSVYIGLASTPNDIHVESTTPTPHFSATPSPQHSSSISESSNSEEDLYAFDEPTLAPDSNVSPPQGGSLLMHTINLEGGEDPRLSSAHQSLADFGMKLQKNPLSAFLNIHSHKFASTSQPVTSNYVDESVEEVTQRGYTTVEAENYSKNTKEDIVQETSPTVATITTLHTNPYSTINVDVSPNGEDSRAQEINSYTTQHTPTSTHGTTTDRTAEESELRYTVSTTPAPTTSDDTFIRPIVVPDGPFEMQSFYSGLLRTTEEMKNFIANLNRTLIANEGVTDHESGEQYKSTPTPIQHSDLASTEEENSLHTSSNQILAPIQAAVSLSASEISSAEASSNSEEVKALESAELVVEQQTLEKQPVFKTTIDIQKSIPFEIPHQENSYEGNEESQSTSNDENSTPYQQGSHLPIHQSINEEFSKIDKDASIQNVRSQFLQQVYSAYQSLANNPNASPYYSQIDSNSNKLALPEPEPTQPPKKLYYVYLQGYNSGLNRYAPLPQYSSLYQNNVHQQGLETNYGSQLTKQIAALPPGSFSQSSAHIYRNGEPNLNVATFINHGNLGQSVQYNRLIEQQPTVNYATETVESSQISYRNG